MVLADCKIVYDCKLVYDGELINAALLYFKVVLGCYQSLNSFQIEQPKKKEGDDKIYTV